MTATPATRREFLKATAVASGSCLAVPTIITSAALGSGATPPASDRIVMAGIGLGNQGSGDQRRFLEHPAVQYVAVCDVRAKWRAEAAGRVNERYGSRDCREYLDFRDLLARDDIDAVHIATPDHWHSLMTIAACRAGKDVFLQKPETLTLAEGPLMLAAARGYGRVVSGGSQRVLEDYREIVDPAWAGELGRITSIDIDAGPSSMACYLPAVAPPADIDWDLWLGPAPWQPYNPGRCDGNFGTGGNSWRSYVDFSGGSLTDWGAHNFGGALFAAGLGHLQPEAVDWQADERGGGYATLRYPNGVEVHCNRPAAQRPAEAPATATHGRGIVLRGDAAAIAPRAVPVYRGSRGLHGDFIESVQTRQRPFRDLEIGVNTMVALHLVGIVRQLQRSLRWDRVAQAFRDDPTANRLLDRSRREPWML
ncbi:MAG: putative 4,5-dihydroxyphthalate dehydrogenase [Planctomycetota bacterium]|jgi:predicted dehydrogenase